MMLLYTIGVVPFHWVKPAPQSVSMTLLKAMTLLVTVTLPYVELGS